ncbi:hypothetical protein LEMLEM_LOCUS19521 [Lemmus lemmus]
MGREDRVSDQWRADKGVASEYDLQELEFSEYDLQELEFSEYDLQELESSEYDLQELEFSEYDLQELESSEYDLQELESSEYDLQELESSEYDLQELEFSKYDLQELEFSKYDLQELEFSEYDLQELESSEYDLQELESSEYDLQELESSEYDLQELESSEYDLQELESSLQESITAALPEGVRRPQIFTLDSAEPAAPGSIHPDSGLDAELSVRGTPSVHSHWPDALYLRLLGLLQTNQVNRNESVLEASMHWLEEWDRVRQAPIRWLGTGKQDPRTHVSIQGKKETQSGVRGEKSQVESDRIRTWDIQGKPHSLSARCS